MVIVLRCSAQLTVLAVFAMFSFLCLIFKVLVSKWSVGSICCRWSNLADQAVGGGYKHGSFIFRRVSGLIQNQGNTYLSITQSTAAGRCLDTFPVRCV